MISFFLLLYYSNIHTEKYPTWFLNMPISEECFYIVGYAPRYEYLSSSIEEATKVARKKFLTHQRDSIVGERAFLPTPIGKMFLYETIREVVDTANLSKVKLLVVDTVVVKNMVLVLFTDKKSATKPIPLVTDTNWIQETPKIPGWVIEKGISPLYEYEHNSWLSAEKAARISLASIFKYQREDLKKFERDRLSGASLEYLNSTVSGIRVLARYINREKGYCGVLIGIRSYN